VSVQSRFTRAELEAARWVSGHWIFECAACGRTVPAGFVGPGYPGPYPAMVLPDGSLIDSICWMKLADEVGR